MIKYKYNTKDWTVKTIDDNTTNLSLTTDKKESLKGSNKEIVFTITSLEEDDVSDYDLKTISDKLMPAILEENNIKITKNKGFL